MQSRADMTGDSPQHRRLHGWGLVVLIALALLGVLEPLLNFSDQPGVRGHFGFVWGATAPMVLSAVYPGEAADRAGVRVGDRIDLDRLYPVRTATYDPVIGYVRAPGTRVELPLIRGTKRLTAAITMGSAVSGPTYFSFSNDLSNFVDLLIVLLAAWIVVRRPTLMTWSLFAYVLTPGSQFVLSRFGYGAALANAFINALFIATPPFLIVFTSRVPNDVSSGWRRWFAVTAIALFAVMVFVAVYSIVAWSVLGLPTRDVFLPWWSLTVVYYVSMGLALAALAVSYAVARGQDRERMRWVVFGVLLTAADAGISTNPSLLWSPSSFFITSITLVLFAMGLAAIAYGLIKGRIVDVTFVLGHAVVAAVLAGLIVAAFAVADWAVSKVLASTRFGTITDIALAIVIGFSFSGLHRRVDALVDRLFFRQRYSAEQRLKLAARAVLHSTSVDAIREFLVDEPQASLKLSSAALFEPADASTWKRTRAAGWAEGTLEHLAANDTVVLHVLAEQAPLKIGSIRWTAPSLPLGLAHPVVAIPVLARRRVVAIALYGQHSSGADIDAEEVAAIERIADAAGAALDHVEAESLRREVEKLARRNDELMRQLSPRVAGR